MQYNSFVHRLTKVLVDIMFYGGIATCIAVPFLLNWVYYYFGLNQDDVMPLSIVLVTSGIAAVYIMWQLKIIFRTLLGGNPFIAENITCLRKISVACFIIAAIYLAKCFFMFTVATLLLVICFLIVGLFCLTLKDMFKMAVSYKEDTDFTV